VEKLVGGEEGRRREKMPMKKRKERRRKEKEEKPTMNIGGSSRIMKMRMDLHKSR
jgi:hypothetical protein